MATTSIGSSGVTFPDSSTQASSSGVAKAWVNFNGSTAAIRASYNVSSITRNSTGNYTINFTNAFSDANYSISGIAGGTSGSFGVTWFQAGSTNTTTSCVMTSAAPSSFSATDVTGGYLAFFR